MGNLHPSGVHESRALWTRILYLFGKTCIIGINESLFQPNKSTAMRLAAISDIHGNLDALIRVIADIEASGVNRIVCLGDMIGYGPEPEAVVETIRERRIPSLMGNHELAVLDPESLNGFNPLARQSLEKTIPLLSPETIRYIRRLAYFRIFRTCRFVHGFPPDSPRTYLFTVSDGRLKTAFEALAEDLCFLGHTHVPAVVGFDGRSIYRKRLRPGITQLHPDRKYMINVGSVGQPRDGDRHAKYVIWDSDTHHLELRCVSYDIASVAGKIMAMGLPEAHARRLW